MPIIIKEIKALETYGVRHPVLRPGRPLEDCALAEDDLETTFHLGAYESGRHIGVATFLISDATEAPIKIENAMYYQLRGMGVLPDQQGKGVGKLLMLQGMKKLKDHKLVVCQWVLCNKGDSANPDVRPCLVACETNHGDKDDSFHASYTTP